MTSVLKALHILGIALFLGSILGHAVIGAAEGIHDSPATLWLARQSIDVATWRLTLPGLVLLAVTGATLFLRRRASLSRLRWMKVHLVLAALIALNAILVLVPTGQAILTLAADLVEGTGNVAALPALQGRETIFGAINILLAVTALFVAVLRPRLGASES